MGRQTTMAGSQTSTMHTTFSPQNRSPERTTLWGPTAPPRVSVYPRPCLPSQLARGALRTHSAAESVCLSAALPCEPARARRSEDPRHRRECLSIRGLALRASSRATLFATLPFLSSSRTVLPLLSFLSAAI
jgi:hypothetical protein